MTDHERDQAIKQGHCNAASEAYFEPRKDFRITGHQGFDAGFDRGWDAGRAPLLERIAELGSKLARQAEQMCRIAKVKLSDLIERGHSVCGVMIEKTHSDGKVTRGAVSNGGMVIWWHPEPMEAAHSGAQQAETQEPFAYLYHDATSAEQASSLLSSTLIVLAADRRPTFRNETPLFARPQPAQLQRLSEEETMAAWRGVDDAGDDRRNAMLYGDAIQSALAAKNGAELK